MQLFQATKYYVLFTSIYVNNYVLIISFAHLKTGRSDTKGAISRCKYQKIKAEIFNSCSSRVHLKSKCIAKTKELALLFQYFLMYYYSDYYSDYDDDDDDDYYCYYYYLKKNWSHTEIRLCC